MWTAARGDRSATGELVGAADMLREVSGAGHRPVGDPRPSRRLRRERPWRHGRSPRAAARGRLHSLASAVALSDALLAASFAPPTEVTQAVDGAAETKHSASA